MYTKFRWFFYFLGLLRADVNFIGGGLARPKIARIICFQNSKKLVKTCQNPAKTTNLKNFVKKCKKPLTNLGFALKMAPAAYA